MVDAIMESPEGTRIQILVPVVRGRKGEFQKLLEKNQKNGFVRIRVDGQMRETSEEIKLEKTRSIILKLL